MNRDGDIGAGVVSNLCALGDARAPASRIVTHHHDRYALGFEHRLQDFGDRKRELEFGIAVVRCGAAGVAGLGHTVAGIDKLIDLARMGGIATVVAGIDSDDLSPGGKTGDRGCGGRSG